MKKGILIIVFTAGLFARMIAQEVIVADTLYGCDTVQVTFNLQNAADISSYSSVEWDFDDGTTATGTLNPVHTYRKGTFTVTCLLNGTKLLTMTEQIKVRLSPLAAFSWKDSTETEGTIRYYFETLTLPPAGVDYFYFWSFPDGASYTTSSVLHEFTVSGVTPVIHIVTDDFGCTDTLVRIIPVSETLLVPNVFSPNGDSDNDYFEVTTSGEIIYRFSVYSPAGLKVYFSESPHISWDGRTFSGKEVPVGVYYYVIESSDPDHPTELCGFLHLFR